MSAHLPGGNVAPEPELISRFTIAILACLLLGMGLGSRLPPQHGIYVTIAGITGMAYYFVCVFRGHLRRAQHAIEQRRHVERRLETQLYDSGLFDMVQRPRAEPGATSSLQDAPSSG